MLKSSSTRVFLGTLGVIALLSSACSNNNQAAAGTTTPTARTEQTQAPNAQAGQHNDVAAALQEKLIKINVSTPITSVHATAMPDIYLVKLQGMPPVFTDKTGSYLIQGEIISLATEQSFSVSDRAIADIAKDTLMGVNPDEMIIFSPQGTPKTTLYVFTDPTCHYCQLLHKDIDQLTAAGIEVRYLAWPRSEQSIAPTKAVWCSSDRKQALTDAMQGKMPTTKSCDDPVDRHSELGVSLGVNGTPAVFTSAGERIGGYAPPDELIKLALAKP